MVSVFILLNTGLSWAHTPQDNIDALEISPAFNNDRTLFIINVDKLLKSTDGGNSWKRSINDLDNKHLLSSIAISPNFEKDQTIFITSNGDGIYKSKDGGTSWQKVNKGLTT